MAKRKSNPGTLVRFVTRAISDKWKNFADHRPPHEVARAYAKTAIGAVGRGKRRGCK
jgi:hypothetical protein